ncbi:hypothetical protein HPB52_009119 [Rhipicephalus sanguineus]|uniref:Mutator-like transposase domain-containing protein n=1 Tax=Rhipicephalus sanguineus TaxID=34632 RepID=A0A9D4YMI8_RHISA|nr:hypothetical protein HPB52_009119 [Rhipicephalus sanguineus]
MKINQTVSDYLKQKAKILEAAEKASAGTQKNFRDGSHPQLEEALNMWLSATVARKIPVSGDLLRQKAETLALRMGFMTGIEDSATGQNPAVESPPTAAADILDDLRASGVDVGAALQRAERRHLGLDLKLFSLCTFCAISKWRRSSRTAAVAGFLKVVSRPLIGSHAARFSSAPFRFFHAIEMPGDSRLKPSTQRAFGSRKKRAWNKKAPATSAPSAAELESRPDPLDLPGTSTDDTVGPSSTSETLRVDAAYYSTAEQAQRVERSAQTKTVLSGKSATQRKFDLLGVSAECQTGDAGTDFLLVDMKVLNNFFAQAKCDKCDAKSLSVRKATDKEYGLAVKLIFSCSSCDFEKKQFSSPRVSGTATITPFEVNMRAMKGIQMIGKETPAIPFCCLRLAFDNQHESSKHHAREHSL